MTGRGRLGLVLVAAMAWGCGRKAEPAPAQPTRAVTAPAEKAPPVAPTPEESADARLVAQIERLKQSTDLNAAFWTCDKYWSRGRRAAALETLCGEVRDAHLDGLKALARRHAEDADPEALLGVCRDLEAKAKAAPGVAEGHAKRACEAIMATLGGKQARALATLGVNAAYLKCRDKGWLAESMARSPLGSACAKARKRYAARRFKGGSWRFHEGYEMALPSGLTLVVPEGATRDIVALTLSASKAAKVPKPPAGYRSILHPFALGPDTDLVLPVIVRVPSDNAPEVRLMPIGERYRRAEYPAPDAVDGRDALFLVQRLDRGPVAYAPILRAR